MEAHRSHRQVDSFHLFAQLPPEVRQHVWRLALAEGWSLSRLKRVHGSGLRLVGTAPHRVAQTCREARAVMRMGSVPVAGLGRIDFARHVFFFRDAEANRGVMEQAVDLLRRIQHMVLNPRDWPRLWCSLDTIRARCAELRSLTIVAPWFDPAAILDAHADDPGAAFDALDLAPYEVWTPLFRSTPAEMPAPQMDRLLRALEHGVGSNAERMARYRTNLDRAVRLIPPDVDVLDNAYGRTRIALRRVDRAVAEFAGATPAVYLRSQEELMSRVETQG